MNSILNKSLLSAMFLVLLSVGCKKQPKEGENNDTVANEKEVNASQSSQQTKSTFTIPTDANEETVRIINDITDADYEVGIIDNPNYGLYSYKPEYDIYINGMTRVEDNITIKLNGVEYSGSPVDGQWMSQGMVFRNYIGTNVNVEILSGSTILKQASIYVPKAHLVAKLGDEGTIRINRVGNVISWSPDNASTTGKIVLYYKTYNVDGVLLETTGLIINDASGSYNIDSILANTEVKKIAFTLVSGNAISTMVNGKKLLFQISTRDQHEYLIN